MRGSCWVASVLLLLPLAARSFSYDESTDGDLSGDRLAPTALVAALGDNELSGSVTSGDLDYVRITLPQGLQLSSLVLDSVASQDDLAFIGLQEGTTFTVTPATATMGALLGYAHFGTGAGAGGATPGNDILDDLGAAFRAQGFVPPLTGSDYTFWIQQTAPQSFAYSFDFVVTPIPEPDTVALLGFGLLAIAGRRRASRNG